MEDVENRRKRISDIVWKTGSSLGYLSWVIPVGVEFIRQDYKDKDLASIIMGPGVAIFCGGIIPALYGYVLGMGAGFLVNKALDFGDYLGKRGEKL